MTDADGPAPSRRGLERIRGAGGRGRALIQKYGPDAADLFFVGILVMAIAVGLLYQTWRFRGEVLVATMIGLSLCFLITSRSLKILGCTGLQRSFIALAAVVCAAWLFEYPYHYSFPTALDRIGTDLSNFGRNTNSKAWPFWWGVIMMLMPFTGMRYMRLNRWVLAFAAAGAVTFFFWWGSGYPQVFNPEWWPNQSPWIHTVPDQFRHPRLAWEKDIVAWYGGWANSVTKVLICLIPAMLFLPTHQQRKAAPPLLEQKLWARAMEMIRQARARGARGEPEPPTRPAVGGETGTLGPLAQPGGAPEAISDDPDPRG